MDRFNMLYDGTWVMEDGGRIMMIWKVMSMIKILGPDNDLRTEDGSLTEIGFDEAFSDWAGRWINEAVKLTEKDDPRADYIPCTILLRSTGEVIGSVGCTYFEDTGKTGICFFVGADYRRNGYASEAVKAYIPYFFERYGEPEIIAVIKDNNIYSRKVAEKSGFKLLETRMYKDIGDEKEELYRFYGIKKNS